MQYLNIQKISAHLLWGIYYTENGNLYHGLNQYHSNAEYRISVDENVARIKQYWVVMRLIYFIFNISNYHQNVYTTLIHQSLTNESSFDDKKVFAQQANEVASYWMGLCFKLASWLGITYFFIRSSYCYSFLSNIKPEGSQWPDLERPLTLEEKAAYYGSQISESRSEITVDMKKHLSVLKMSTDDKTHISKKEVEDAYKKLARCYHTDKGGDVDNFHAIAEAKEALLLLIGTDASKESLLNVESLISTQAKIKEMKASLFQGQASNASSSEPPADYLRDCKSKYG